MTLAHSFADEFVFIDKEVQGADARPVCRLLCSWRLLFNVVLCQSTLSKLSVDMTLAPTQDPVEVANTPLSTASIVLIVVFGVRCWIDRLFSQTKLLLHTIFNLLSDLCYYSRETQACWSKSHLELSARFSFLQKCWLLRQLCIYKKIVNERKSFFAEHQSALLQK